MDRSETHAGETSSMAVFHAFWRWHFYAGLIVLPLLMLMAATGGLYLFKDEINGGVYRSMMSVEARSATTAPQTWIDAAVAGGGGKAVRMIVPESPERSVEVTVEAAPGVLKTVFVDPYDAAVLGVIPDGGVMALVKRLHSLDLAGPVANLLVEVVAGWAIVMVATGVVLWWPRGGAKPSIAVRGAAARRLFWRDLHALVGLLSGAVIVFLAATGMPWSAFWGAQARNLVTEAGLGRPPPPAGAATFDHGGHGDHDAPAAANPAVPWALEETQVHSGHASHGLTVGDAVARVEMAGLQRPYTLTIPSEPGRAWSASHMPPKVENTRTLYLDGGDGRVIEDVGYARFGAGAKAIEWGISVHQGRQFGLPNKLLMLAGCISIWLLGATCLVMWWKRRPAGGRLTPPPAPADRRAYRRVALVVVPLGLFYPLVGASLIVVGAVDLLLTRLLPRVFSKGAAQ